MKIAQKQLAAPQADPRAIPLPLLIDDLGLASRVQTARTAEDAWRLLSDVPASPATLERLSRAALDCCTASDAIGQGLIHFGTLPPDAEVPDGWVDRMVELYAAYLEGYWRLDDLAWEGLRDGGWTVTSREPLADDPAGRLAQRARWVAEECPSAPHLAVDKARRALDGAVADAGPNGPYSVEDVKETAHRFVAAAVRYRYADWQTHRKAATGMPT